MSASVLLSGLTSNNTL